MAKSVEGLTDDQTRRIYRDYLLGRPMQSLLKKYDITEETFWDVYGLYAKKKHPNDVGNAKDILGPADPLVTKLDTGSGATENPIVARNPRDMEVVRPLVVENFDHDATAKEREEAAKAREKELLEVENEVKEQNREATDATLEAIAESAESEAEAITEASIEKAKAAPTLEQRVEDRNRMEAVVRRDEAEAAKQRDDRIRQAFKEGKEYEAKMASLAEEEKNAREQAAESTGEARPGETGKLPDRPTGGSVRPATPSQLGGESSQSQKDSSRTPAPENSGAAEVTKGVRTVVKPATPGKASPETTEPVNVNTERKDVK